MVREKLGELQLSRRMILECILMKYIAKLRIEFNWLRISYDGSLLQ